MPQSKAFKVRGQRVLTQEQRQAIQAISQPTVIRFFKNVVYLLKLQGMSKDRFEREMKKNLNFGISADSIKRFTDGVYTDASLFYMGAYCLALGEPLEQMLCIDYEAQAISKQVNAA